MENFIEPSGVPVKVRISSCPQIRRGSRQRRSSRGVFERGPLRGAQNSQDNRNGDGHLNTAIGPEGRKENVPNEQKADMEYQRRHRQSAERRRNGRVDRQKKDIQPKYTARDPG
jgi:hypothetical protein